MLLTVARCASAPSAARRRAGRIPQQTAAPAGEERRAVHRVWTATRGRAGRVAAHVVRVDAHEVAQAMRHENSRQVQRHNLRINDFQKSDATARNSNGFKGR